MVALGRLHMAERDFEKARRIYRSMLLQNLDPAAGVSKADVYLALLRELERHRFDVFAHKPYLRRRKKLAIAVVRWLREEPSHLAARIFPGTP